MYFRSGAGAPAGALDSVDWVGVDGQTAQSVDFESDADWWQALSLVRGAPFANQRPGGYGWLAGRPVDHEYTATIVDLAHAVATHHLAVGEPDRAEAERAVRTITGLFDGSAAQTSSA